MKEKKVLQFERTDVVDVDLLTRTQYEKYKHLIPGTTAWWWLKTPSESGNTVAYVGANREVNNSIPTASHGGIRPVFYLNDVLSGDTVSVCDTVYVGDVPCTIVDTNCAVSNKVVAYRAFDSSVVSALSWEDCELREYMHSPEFLSHIGLMNTDCLPKELKVSLAELMDTDPALYEEICDFASEYISDQTGFCHNGFTLDGKIEISEIKYDCME